MRRLSKNIAAALIMTMSLSMLPAQFQPVEASAAQAIEATVSKAQEKPVEPKQPETPDKGGQTESGLKSLVRTKGNLHMGGDDGELTIGSGFAVKDAGEWLQSITAITVDGVKYSNVGELGYLNKVKENQYGFAVGFLKIRRPNNNKKEVALVIESSIYKSYTIIFDNSSPYSADIISMEETKKVQNTEPAFTGLGITQLTECMK